MENRIREFINIWNEFSYEDKLTSYKNIISTQFFGDDMNAKMVLISLLARTFIGYKKKYPTKTMKDLVFMIAKPDKNDSSYINFLESLSVMTEDFSYGCTKFDACGCTTSKEAIAKIKQILTLWNPF
jgi:hypothetical protein